MVKMSLRQAYTIKTGKLLFSLINDYYESKIYVGSLVDAGARLLIYGL